MSVKPDAAIAARLAASFDLRGVNFAVIEGRVLQVDGDEPEEGEHELDWKLATVNATWLLDGSELRVVLPFDITIVGDRKPRFAMQVVLRVDYEIRNGVAVPADDDVDHFAGISGFMHAWPYVRAEIQGLTTKLGLPALTLPIIVSGHVPEKVVVHRAPKSVAQLPPSKGTAKARARSQKKRTSR